MVRILPIISSAGNSIDFVNIRHRLRLPVLDGDWAAERVFSVRDKLPDSFTGLQSGVPRRRAFDAYHQRRRL